MYGAPLDERERLKPRTRWGGGAGACEQPMRQFQHVTEETPHLLHRLRLMHQPPKVKPRSHRAKQQRLPTQSRLGCRKLPKPLIAGLSETGTRPGPPHMNRDPYITMASAPWAQAHENARSKAALTSLPSLAVSHREIGAAEWCSSVRLFSGISFLANKQPLNTP